MHSTTEAALSTPTSEEPEPSSCLAGQVSKSTQTEANASAQRLQLSGESAGLVKLEVDLVNPIALAVPVATGVLVLIHSSHQIT